MFQKLLRIYSYLFALATSAACLALGLISKLSGTALTMDNMPWKGNELSDWLLGIGALGLISVIAAVSGGRLRFLLPIFMGIVVYLMIKGNFMGAHSFADSDDFKRTLWIAAGAVLALLGSLLQLTVHRTYAPRPVSKAAAK